MIINVIPAQYSEGIEIIAPASVLEEQVIKSFFTVASIGECRAYCSGIGWLDLGAGVAETEHASAIYL